MTLEQQRMLLTSLTDNASRMGATNGNYLDMATAMMFHVFHRSGLSPEQADEYLEDITTKVRNAYREYYETHQQPDIDTMFTSGKLSNRKLRHILDEFPADLEVRLQSSGMDRDDTERINEELTMKVDAEGRMFIVLPGIKDEPVEK